MSAKVIEIRAFISTLGIYKRNSFFTPDGSLDRRVYLSTLDLSNRHALAAMSCPVYCSLMRSNFIAKYPDAYTWIE